jgi:hypothetical protein
MYHSRIENPQGVTEEEMVKRFLAILTFTILVFFGASALEAQQVTCTPSVPPTICKQFDSDFGPTSMWPSINFTRGVEIVIVDPAQFKAERTKWDAEKERAGNNVKTIRDRNRVTGREAGGGVFDQEILECPNSAWVKRIVISTEAMGGSQNSSVSELSDQLLFYVIGYDQGLGQGEANEVE